MTCFASSVLFSKSLLCLKNFLTFLCFIFLYCMSMFISVDREEQWNSSTSLCKIQTLFVLDLIKLLNMQKHSHLS